MDTKCMFFVLLVLAGFFIDDAHCWWTSRRRRRRCNAQNCHVSNWSSWNGCSRSCGSSGTQTRQRRVTRAQSCGGGCYPLSETRACNRVCCPVNCAWSWGNWGSCQGCGRGTQTRSVVVSVSPSCGGSSCPSQTQTQSCDTGRCCPVNCVVSSWGSWGSCNAQCEKSGLRSRTRRITTAVSCNGTPCPGLTQYNSCNGPCCRRDCVLSQWTGWGACSAPSGVCSANSGTHSRSRTLVTRQSCGGTCFPLQESKACTPVPRQCQVSQWGIWSTCTPKSGNCGAGTQARTRTITSQPYCAPACPATSENRDCVHSCCPVNCVLSSWTAWGACSSKCGQGSQVRNRRVVTPSSCGGTCSSLMTQTQQCTVVQKVDCQVSSWSSWSICSSGCGNGLQQRSRTVTRQPTLCGLPCGNLTETRQCQSYRENRDCQVGGWTTWGRCNSKCSYGRQLRSRNVITAKRCNGANCPSLQETKSCGLPNGGCGQLCQESNGTCYCLPGYEIHNRTHCKKKDCGKPVVDYCPPGEANGTVCRQPWITCPNGATVFQTKCTVSCLSTYRLTGLASITCETDGDWSDGLATSYCRRINDPPSDIVLSGSHVIAENSPIGTLVGSFSSVDINSKDNHTHSLVPGGSYQGKFNIIENSLYTKTQFDYETGPKSYSLGITSRDNGNPPLSYTKYITVNIGDINEPPSDILISSSQITENSDVGSVVGNFDTTDVDVGQINTYRLIDSANGMFRINSNSLEVAKPNTDCLTVGSPRCPLNFEGVNTFSVEVESSDNRSPPFSIRRIFNISVNDANDPPYGIIISSNTIKENATLGTTVGQLRAKDEDASPKQSITFTLVDDDEGRFSVNSNGTVLKAKDIDYETDKSHVIEVRATDNGSPPASNTRKLTIVVLDVNEPPINITMIPSEPYVSENASIGTFACMIEAYDSDFITTLNFTLDDDAGGRFKVDSAQSCVNSSLDGVGTACSVQLLVDGSLNFEEANSHLITVRAEDRGHFLHRTFSIGVSDSNDPPSSLLINGKKVEKVAENSPGAIVGQLFAVDEDINQTHIFSLSDKYLSTFVLEDNLLKLAANFSFDYETKKMYTLTMDVTDDGNPAATSQLTIDINVTNVNEAPTDILISADYVDENSPEGTTVANITVIDPDDKDLGEMPDYHSCSLLESAGGRFKIVNRVTLVVGSGKLNFERQSNHTIEIECSDGKLPLSKSFHIKIADVNELPTTISLSSNKVPENLKSRYAIGSLSTIDPDNLAEQRQTFTYSIAANDSRFDVSGDMLYSMMPFDYETSPVVLIQVMSTDNGVPSLSKYENLRIEVTDANDAPKDILISNSVVDENCADGTVVGTLTTSDEDLGQDFTYQLANSADGRFKIEKNVVKVAATNVNCLKFGKSYCRLNYEEKQSHVIEITTIDDGSPPLSLQKNITIFLRNINDRPRDVRLSDFTVNETAPVNHIIGQFSAWDEDKGQNLTYTLTRNDNERFGVDRDGNLYKATNETNYETNKTHSITVKVTDNGNPPLEISMDFLIEVLDVNEAPIKTSITNKNGQLQFPSDDPKIEENSEIGTVIGTIISYDSEPVENLTFALDDSVAGTFSLGKETVCANSTNIVGARSMCSVKLVLSRSVNFEAKSIYPIIVRTTDNEGLFHVQRFNIKVTDKNDAPTGILIGGLKYAIVPENQPGTLIDEMTTIDEDVSQAHMYSVLGNNSHMVAVYRMYLFLSLGTGFDYENQTSHLITINSTDSGKPPFSFVETLELRVQDVNEAPTEITLTGKTVLENSPVGTIVANLTVTDPDNAGQRGSWQSHTCVIASGSSGLLTITRQQLVVAHNGIDYEQAPSLNISIRCEDSGKPVKYLEKWFLIEVQDVNEKPTRISLSTNSIAENSLPGGIGMLSTFDPDNSDHTNRQSFTYTLTNSDPNLPFAINGNILETTRMLDHENQTSWILGIRSTDNGDPPLYVDHTFAVNVTDVNEQPYDIVLDKPYVDENSGFGTVVGSLSTRDPDRGQSNSYSLTDDASGLFRIENAQLKVAVDSKNCLALGGDYCRINFEKQQSIDVRIKTEDNGSPKLSFEKSITIFVRDVNDKPRDIQLSANHLPENATKGFSIGQLNVTDEDVGQNITFKLINDDNGIFALNEHGFIVKAKDTNYESAKAHQITVQASDDGNPVLTVTKNFVIIVQDVNESPSIIEITSDGGPIPFPKNQSIVNENSAKNTIVGTLRAYDEDAVESLRFSLDDDGNGAFAIDNAATCANTTVDGKSHTVCSVLLKVAGAIDYETETTKSIIVRVTDNNGLHHSQLFTITVRDQNDQPYDVLLNGLYTGFVNENEDNTLIATFETRDGDNGQLYSYRILNDADMAFIISRGKLYTSPHAALNYEKQSSYSILVETTDNGSPPLSFQRNLTVKVVDVNEAPTTLSLSRTHIDENSPVGTTVGNISVVDPDNEGKYKGRQISTCQVINDAFGMFDVINRVKLVTKKASLDYESRDSYNLRLRCTDDGVPSKSIEKDLTINVNDVNEAPTSVMLTSGSVDENLRPVTVGRLVVSDPDKTIQTFALSVMDKRLPFRVVGRLLQTTRPLNFEQQHSYKIAVKAIDQGGLSVVENFTIHVQDRNDRPSSLLFTGDLSIEENSPVGALVATVSAVDEDFYQTHSYAIESITGYGVKTPSSLPGYFTIGAASGQITSAVNSIDYEEFKAINITVIATDNGTPTLSVRETVTIQVRDVNHPPTDILFSGRYVTENSPMDTIVGNFTVIDPDNKFNHKQSFTCMLRNTARDVIPFKISNDTLLKVNGIVDYEKKQVYSLQVTCTEVHANPYNITKTFIVNVININEAPKINITSNKVYENQDPGAVVGTVFAVDPDNELTLVDNVTIELLPELDSGAFQLVGGSSLITNRRFDYEQKNMFTVKLRAQDNGLPALSTEKILHIMVQNLNDRPTEINLSSTVVAENSPKGTIIGDLGTVDEDAGQIHSYSFINTIDNLAINGRHLIVSGKLDFETEPMIYVLINVTDSGNPSLSYQKPFNITVTDSNDAPSDIAVTMYSVPENNTADVIVANLKVIDEDRGHSVRSCLAVNNPGYFYFRNGVSSDTVDMFIRGSADLDFETAPVINSTIQCFDNGSPALSVQKIVSIEVVDSNDKPTKVMINGSNIVFLPENSPSEAVIGQLTCADQDYSQSHSYTIQSGGDIFMISENSDLLRVKNSSQLDYEKLGSSKRLPVSIKVTDNGQPSMSLTAAIQVEVTDVNEAPINIRLLHVIASKIPENVTIGTHIGELFADNPEGFRQQLTFSVLNWRDTFTVTEGHGPGKVSYLTIKGELDVDVVNRYNITVKVTDNGSPPMSVQSILTLQIKRSDPCFTGTLNCGSELCQRVNKTHGNCGCLAGFEPINGNCRQINDCKADCQYCDNPKKACQAKRACLPCSNNGTCVDQLMDYKCVCLPGFTDDRCKTNIDDCASKPCQHGTCFDLVNNHSCECDEGYEGRNCQINIDECKRKECVKGDCTDLIAAFSCSCAQNVWGLLCNRLEYDCTPDPCSSKVCVPPGYPDIASLEKGGKKVLCANDDQVVTLSFSLASVPDDKLKQDKWKYIFRNFITQLVGIPFYAVDLEESLSNGGFYKPTDIVMYPFKSAKTKRDVAAKSQSLLFPLVVRVQDKLVPQDAFLRAVNKTCANIKKSSIYWVYCDASYIRIKELGITPETGKSTKEKPVGGFKILKGNNIYILIGGGAGLLLIIAIVVMTIARRRRAIDSTGFDTAAFVGEGGGSYYDAMERHIARRADADVSAVNPMYGDDEDEVSHENRMFSNPLYGAGDILHDSENEADGKTDEADGDTDEGVSNPLYNTVQWYGVLDKSDNIPHDSDC